MTVLQHRFLKQQAVKYMLKEKWEKYKQEERCCMFLCSIVHAKKWRELLEQVGLI